MEHSSQIITFLSPKTGLCFNLKLDLDPIFLSRELLSQGTMSKAKHRRLAGTEYFGETAVQPRDNISVNHAETTESHFRGADMTIHNHV